MSNTVKEKQPLPKWRRILLGLVLTAMMLVAVFILVGYFMGRRLGKEIVKISRAGEPITFLDLQPNPSPGAVTEDAGSYYVEALSSIPPGEVDNLSRVRIFYHKNIMSLPINQFPSDTREKITGNLANLQSVLGKFDKGADLPLSDFDIGVEYGMEVYQTRLRSVRTAALLLSLQTLNSILNGQGDAAANSTISSLRMIRIFDFRPIMTLHAARVVLIAQVCQDVQILLEHCRPSEKSLVELQKALSEAIGPDVLEKMLYAERVYQIELGRNLIPGKISSRFLSDNVPDLPERLPLPRNRWGRLRIRQKATGFLRDMAWLITAVRRHWPESLDIMVARVTASKGDPDSLLTNTIITVRITIETIVFVRCTTLAIAIERYRRAHGQLPGSLDDVVPAYIETVPLDPFTGKKLLYHYDKESYVVYSVGLNRQDDGGSVMHRPDIPEGRLDHGLRIRFGQSQ
ncbi:MAG: hypothetical protein ACYS1A_05455 [Planctomycetota bacterium]|jgi:hypothetical protein